MNQNWIELQEEIVIYNQRFQKSLQVIDKTSR